MKNARPRWTKILLITALALTTTFVTGCSKKKKRRVRLTQKEMMRRAIRRPKDPEDDESKASVEKKSKGKKTGKQQPGQVANPGNATNTAAVNNVAGTKKVQTKSAEAPIPTDKLGGPRPDKPLSEAERLKRTSDNLAEIGAALKTYVETNRRFPALAIYARGTVALSWRVEILPMLGLQSLYDRFRLDEPWDSPHNIKLLKLMPAVYQSPERFDEKTNYVVPVAGGTIFSGKRPTSARKVEDGLAGTIAVLEVDEAKAVPWTKPEELPLVRDFPKRSLGALRGGRAFAIFADGTTAQLSLECSDREFYTLFSKDAGDADYRGKIARFINLKPTTVAQAPNIAISLGAAPNVATPTGSRSTTITNGSAQNRPASATAITRLEVPSEDAQKKSQSTLRDLFEDDWKDAKTDAARRQLAQKMHEHVAKLGDDADARYVLLTIIKDVSVTSKDLELALKCCTQLGKDFTVNEWKMKLRAMQKIASGRRTRNAPNTGAQKVMQRAKREAEDALKAEEYEIAAQISRLVLTAIKNAGNDKRRLNEYSERSREIEAFHRAHVRAQAAIEKLDDGADAEASFALGSYLCFYREKWDDGLVVLKHCGNPRLKSLAKAESEQPLDGADQLDLADQWWDYAETATSLIKRRSRERAAHWYQQAVSGLPAGLERVKAQKRISEMQQKKGRF